MWRRMHNFNIVLKSRQHGFTTFFCLIMLDACLFNSNIRAGVIAHEQKKALEIFNDKVKWPYHQLPKAIREIRETEKMDGGELRLNNNSGIRVSTSMRSGTLHYLLISEHGKLCAKYPKRALELKTGTLPTVHEGSVIWNESTAEGPAGDFYDMAILSQSRTAEVDKKGEELGPIEYRFHFFPWYTNSQNQTEPTGIKISDELKRYFTDLEEKGIVLNDRQKAWYSITKDGPAGLGRYMKQQHPSTVPEAFEQSVEGAIFGAEMEKAYSDGRVGFYPHLENLPVDTFWDLGYHHATSVIFTQYYGEQIRVIDHHRERGRGAAYHAKVVTDKPYIYRYHYFPHDVMQHEKGSGIVLGDTYSSLLKKDYQVVARPKLKEDSIQSAYNIFPQVVFNAKTTKELRKSLSFYRYAWDENIGQFSKEPVDDPAADDADAFELMAMQYRLSTVDGPPTEWEPSVSGSTESMRKRAWNAPKKRRR